MKIDSESKELETTLGQMLLCFGDIQYVEDLRETQHFKEIQKEDPKTTRKTVVEKGERSHSKEHADH